MLDPWFPFVPPNESGALRLFCFPFAGGGAGVYRTWLGQLPGIDVWPVQLPGREHRLRDAPIGDLRELVDAMASAVVEKIGGAPFALFGHSMGASIAHRLTRVLADDHGLAPRHFFASGAGAPHIPKKKRILHDLSDEDFFAALRDLGGTPPAVLASAELMELFEPMLRADMRVSETYVCDPADRITAPLTLLTGAEDEEVDEGRQRAWSELAAGPFRHVELPGDHFFIKSAEDAVLAEVRRSLEGA